MDDGISDWVDMYGTVDPHKCGKKKVYNQLPTTNYHFQLPFFPTTTSNYRINHRTNYHSMISEDMGSGGEPPSEFDDYTSRRRSENRARGEDQQSFAHKNDDSDLQARLAALEARLAAQAAQQEERARQQEERARQQEERVRQEEEERARQHQEERAQLMKTIEEMQQQNAQLLQDARLRKAPGAGPDDSDDSDDSDSEDEEVFEVKSARDLGGEAWHRANIEKLKNRFVTNYGERVRIGDLSNISVELIYYTVVDMTNDCRICITIGPEQCQKSAYIAIHVIAAFLIGRPSISFIKDVKASVETTCHDKIANILESFDIETLFVDHKDDLVNMDDEDIEKFKTGKLSIVAQTNHKMINQVHKFVRKNKVFDIALALDEADAVFSSAIDRDNIVESAGSAREREMLKLFDINKVDDEHVLFRNGRIRCSAFVSATHMSTINLIGSMGFPMNLHAMDLAEVKARGYAVSDAVVPFKDAEGRPVFVPTVANSKNHYHLKSEVTHKFMKEFVEDCAVPGQ